MGHNNLLKRIGYLLIILGFFLPVSASGWTVAFLAGSGGLGDESFNDMAWLGLGKAREECGFKLIFREWEPHIPAKKIMQEVLDQGAELVVLNGDQFSPLIQEFAPRYKDILFIANDFYGGDFTNLKSILYQQQEGAFLAGALASLHSHSGKIGFIGASDIPIIKAFEVGFTEGVKYISPETQVTIDYISDLQNYSGFNNTHKAFELATSRYKDGIDIIFAVAGMSGNGVIQAAKATDKFAIGVDADQDRMAKGHVLTSVMKRLDIAIYTETMQAFQGRFSPGTVHYGLANEGMSLSPMHYTSDIIGEKTLKKVHTLKDKIISGEIIVTDYLKNSR